MPETSSKTIGRLSLYRRLLDALREEGAQNVYSHGLASLARVTPAQVRRDLMAVGYSGSPTRGYGVRELMSAIGRFLDAPQGQSVALVGLGNLGRAILAFFAGRRPKLSIVAAFDIDPQKVNRVIHGCRCYPVDDLEQICREESIGVAILTVPPAVAQEIADRTIRAGVRGLLNYAPVPLRVPSEIYVENRDMTMALEKVAYFAGKAQAAKEKDK